MILVYDVSSLIEADLKAEVGHQTAPVKEES